jgi:hypothetical protein
MKHIVKLDKFDNELDEMAKLWPVGSIIKATTTYQAKTTTHMSREGRKWYDHSIYVDSDVREEGAFYMKAEFSGRAWIEGTILFTNSVSSYVAPGTIVKIPVDSASTAGPEYKILEANKAAIDKLYGKTIFLDGKEPQLMTTKGLTVKDMPEGEYVVTSVSFGLTKEMGEPVLALSQRRSSKPIICVKMTDFDGLGHELSTEHNEVIADWFSKKTGMEVKWDGRRFEIPVYKVTGYNELGNSTSNGPFYSMEDANKFVEIMKKAENASLIKIKPSDLSVKKDYSTVNNNLEDMIKIMRKLGVEVNMKDLLTLKKGQVSAKKLGLLDSLEWKPGKK